MATCKKCNHQKLEWVSIKGKWRLYDLSTGKWHDEICKITGEDLQKINIAKLRGMGKSCRHGILKSNWCDLCESERQS